MGKITSEYPQNSFQNYKSSIDQEIFHENQEDSTSPNILKYSQKVDQNKKKGIKKEGNLKKQRKKRVFQPDCRFEELHKRIFYLFPFYFATNYPFFKISWQFWKPNKYFVKMAEFYNTVAEGFSKKTTIQCKSFDQRQKKMVYHDKDLLQAAYSYLQSTQHLGLQTRSLLQNFLAKIDSKSDYMAFIQNDQNFYEGKRQQICQQKQQTLQCGGNKLIQESSFPNQNTNEVFNEFLDIQLYNDESAEV